MAIPINPQNKQVYRLTRELEQAQEQLNLALARCRILASDLAAAKARRSDETMTDEQAALAEVCQMWGIEL